jgi:hypothetical protein
MTNWIMGCITSTTYVVLINGEPIEFFNGGRGLRQGCLLSPLLFILIMEGLSLALKKMQEEGLVTGIKVTRLLWVLHLLFVDDILIMTNDSVNEWSEIHRLLVIFFNAIGLMITPHKSSFYQFGVQSVVLDAINSFIPFEVNHIASGFKYLGYFLKADRYKAEDWDWLLTKFESRISHWCNRWLTLGGQLVLVKAVLESQPVYWLALANISSSILHKIQQVTYNFLWNDNKKGKDIICVAGIILLDQKDLVDGHCKTFLASVKRWMLIIYGAY